MNDSSPPLVVRTLVGKKTVDVSLTCLPTLIRYSAEPTRLVVHEDGSLSGGDRDALRAAIPNVEFICRDRADDETGAWLKKYPRCRAARATNVLFLKLFDVALMGEGVLSYCDSDILFLRPFTGLFGPDSAQYPAFFMADGQEAYAVRPWDLWPLGGIRLASRVNSGLMRIGRGVLDLDFLEWLLGRLEGRSVWRRRWYWNEQTCWAALGRRIGCGLWDPGQIMMASPDLAGRASGAVAIHFVSTYRNLLTQYVAAGRPTTVSPARVACRPSPDLRPLSLIVSDVKARFR